MTKKFLFAKYNHDQIVEALTCPVNRHCARVAHGCDDWELFKHPNWLLEHFVLNGGAKAFAKHREEKQYWIDEEDKQDELEKQKKELPLKGGEDYTNPT